MHTVEFFTMGKSGLAKVGCSGCTSACASKDKLELTPEYVANQLIALFPLEVEVTIHDYSEGDQDQILARQNELYKENDVNRTVNRMLIGPLANHVWPSVVIDGVIRSEGELLDTLRIRSILNL